MHKKNNLIGHEFPKPNNQNINIQITTHNLHHCTPRVRNDFHNKNIIEKQTTTRRLNKNIKL